MNTAQIQEMIDLYVEAEKAILTGQSYSIGNRSLTRANLTEIRNARSEWEQRLVNLTIKNRGGNPNYSVSTFC
jgi:hypothetical protein